MEQLHEFIVEKARLGSKGQITIPKKIRDEDGLKEDDLFIVQHTPGGLIVLRKRRVQTPEDLMLDAIRRMPPFDARAAWKEVKEERRRERA
ncbi:AbrB/MazE/SpoVT family DNA-binding domain-containing protein [Candidatus Woesearchaeota archaeon]|nr:AbrB/MazE/SpoVT family DNA-binding domain-containing protein [Candidatus Woesearchaeota archaeon]